MISFLNSLVLPALAALAIPLIIHFFNRRKARKIAFSSIRFLKLLESQRIKQVRIYQILLILIRTLFILFIVLTFARPTLQSAFISVGAASKTTAVIILDDSYSMQAFVGNVNKFRLALDQIRNLLAAFNPEDEVFILPASTFQNHLTPLNLNSDPAELLKVYPVSYGLPDFKAVFKSAEQLFQNFPNPHRELYVISDMRLNPFALKDSIETILGDRDLMTFLINPAEGETFRNVGIDTVIIENQLFELNKPVRFLVRLRNDHPNESTQTVVNLFREGERLAMESVQIEAGQSREVYISYVPRTTGIQHLIFELEDDHLPVDNYFYTSLSVSEKIKVMLVDNLPSLHLNTAVQVLNKSTELDIENVSYSQWIGKNFERYDLIVLSNPTSFGNEVVERLKSFLDKNNLVIIMGDHLTAGGFNNQFQALATLPMIVDLRKTPRSDFYFPLDANTPRSPLFNPLFRELNADFEQPKIYKYFSLAKPAHKILQLQNGDPFFARFDSKFNGSIFILASALDLEWTDLPIKGFYIPMLYRLLFASAQTDQAPRSLIVNDNYDVALAGHSLTDSYFLQINTADDLPLLPQQSGQGIRFLFEQVKRPGYYRIKKNEEVIHTFSVNVSTKEFKRPYLSLQKLTKDVVTIQSGSDMIQSIKTARTGQELWYIFLTLALLMLLAEMLLIRKIEGQGMEQSA